MNKTCFEYKSDENFEIILNSDSHVLSSEELIIILENYRKVLKGINTTLNRNYCAGYDAVDFDVLAFEQGSFRIPIIIKKFSRDVVVNAIGGIIAGIFAANINKIDVISSGEVIEVKKEELMENHDTKSAVANIAKVAVESDCITSISLNYTNKDGVTENVSIEKKQLSSLASIYTEDIPTVQTFVDSEKLIVLAPVLDGKTVLWKFRKQNGQQISAKMNDLLFLDKMEKEHIAFGKNDKLNVELITNVIDKNDGTQRVSYIINKVIDYPKYKKKDPNQQLTLDL